MKFEKQTYTQMPNSLFTTMKDMDECELKVVLLICRYTFGYHREEVKLSTRRIADEIGMNTASVQKGADKAIERGIIEKYVNGNKTTLWRAIVGDSEFESQVIQNLNRGVSDNESLLGIKETIKENKEIDFLKHTAYRRGEQELPDLGEKLLAMANFPGAKVEARIDALLSYLGETFRRETETAECRKFARYIDSKRISDGWDVKVFVAWLKVKPDYNADYWPFKRMMEFYPSAFVTNGETARPAIHRASEDTHTGISKSEAERRGLIKPLELKHGRP